MADDEVRAAFLCGPDGRVDPDTLTVHDRAAVQDFSRFLSGETIACPTCMAPKEACTAAERCCPDCQGIHVSVKPQAGGDPVVTRHNLTPGGTP